MKVPTFFNTFEQIKAAIKGYTIISKQHTPQSTTYLLTFTFFKVPSQFYTLYLAHLDAVSLLDGLIPNTNALSVSNEV
jgi:hypothetical protein